MSSDRIEKSATLRAALPRVWRAISDSAEFGRWFGMSVDGPFVAGQTVHAVIAPTEVDPEIAEQQRPYAGVPCVLHIVAMEPPRRFAFRWNPIPDPEFADLTTLVEFTLDDTDDGVLLRIVESGFDALPPDRRSSAFDDNSEGWSAQLTMVARYVTEARWA